MNLFVTVTPDVPTAFTPLRFSAVIATDADARPLLPDSVDGAITVYQVLGRPTPLLSSSVLNGASLLAGPVAPGEVIRVAGTTLVEAGLSFDGTPAKLLSAPPNQLSTLVPLSLPAGGTRLQLTSQGQSIEEILLLVRPSSPANFTSDGGGTGQAAVLNEDLIRDQSGHPRIGNHSARHRIGTNRRWNICSSWRQGLPGPVYGVAR